MALDRTPMADRQADDFATLDDINGVIGAINNLKSNVAEQSADDLQVQPDATTAGDRGITFWLTKSPQKWVRFWWDQTVGCFKITDQDNVFKNFGIADAVSSFHAVTKAQLDAAIAAVTIPPGTMLPYAGINLLPGFLWPDGTEISRTAYAGLFNAIGTQYGSGDGTTTFRLPKCNGRTLVCRDNLGGVAANVITASWGSTLGGVGGEEKHTMTIAELVAHTHTENTSSTPYYNVQSGGSPNGMRAPVLVDSGSTGGGNPFNVVQPSFTTNYIIKY